MLRTRGGGGEDTGLGEADPGLAETDPEVWEIIKAERRRQVRCVFEPGADAVDSSGERKNKVNRTEVFE